MSKHIRMFQHGYPGLVDLDGDGRIDTGFNPAVSYVGYFDSSSCYFYRGATFKGLNAEYAYGDPDGLFERAGATVPDDDENAIRKTRPANLPATVVSPPSASGICRGVTGGGQKTFSGNWLNYITTSRMDAIRKVLYGGYRALDTESRTELEGSYVPPDSTVWGTEVRSDDEWGKITPLGAFFDISKYTPFAKPAKGKAHFFARGSDLSKSDRFPALRVLLNVDQNSYNVGGKDGVGQQVVITSPNTRYWDWVLVNRPLPDDKVLKNDAIRKGIKIYRIRVLACEKGNIGESEDCMRFPGKTDSELDDVFKPAGLLQEYGKGNNPMHFGLMTGGYNGTLRNAGGKLRNHVGPVYGVPPFPKDAFVPAVNPVTGQNLDRGLIKNIDNLTIAGKERQYNPTSWEGARYNNVYSWGNPLGEMVYEAVRYMAMKESPTGKFSWETDKDVAGSPVLNLTAFGSGNTWTRGRPSIPFSFCPKPVILLISDISTDYDGDDVGTDLNQPLLTNPASLGRQLTERELPRVFDKDKYLDAVSKIEGLDLSGFYKYFHSTGPNDTCSPKKLTNGLRSVKGMCPDGPSTMGTYSSVAAAYYAHIRDFNPSKNPDREPLGVDVYSVTMSSAFPELTFPVRGSDGKVATSISLLPVNISGAVAGNPIMGFLNYFVIEWDTDRRGMTFHAVIKVNFSDKDMGDDWEGDGQVTYAIDLVTRAGTSKNKRESTPAHRDAGDPSLFGTYGIYYRFKNPAIIKSPADLITIEEREVAGLIVSSSWQERGTHVGMGLGYSITGSTRDGTYLDLTMNTPPASRYLTPTKCPYVGGPGGTNGCGYRVKDLKKFSRMFAFAGGPNVEAKTLPNPMWLAAKYGGFTDSNKNGVPDPGEWEDADGNPRNYFQATNIAELPEKLKKAFRSISKSVKTGTAASASFNTMLGGGLSVQTIYYSEYENPVDNSQRVAWVGSVYGLFVDKWGNLREDTDGDGKLTVANGPDGKTGDHIVTFNDPKIKPASPPPCYEFGHYVTRCFDEFGNNKPRLMSGAAAHPSNIHKVKFVFDTGRFLSSLDKEKLLSGPRGFGEAATIANGKRRIYFGYPDPLPNDPDRITMRLFDSGPASLDMLQNLLLHENSELVLPISGNKRERTKTLVEWILGVDSPGLRKRTVGNPWTDDREQIVWRMGDVLNSKPILIGTPGSNFDYLYDDTSYTAFREANSTRREMAYFGANDGMLRAVNLGFPASLAKGQAEYSIEGPGNETRHALGAELWAYVPTSLLPHLQFMAAPDYTHSHYVDLKPLVLDVKLKNVWRTVLIGGLRQGGRPIVSCDGTRGPEHYYSEVFALDVTDPEKEPELLWRYSSLDLGLTVGLPSVISHEGKWYAILPSGPVTDEPVFKKPNTESKINYGDSSPYAGASNQKARLIVLDMETGKEVDEGKKNANYLRVSEPKSFFNNPFLPVAQKRENPWTDHALYYGLTVSRDGKTGIDSGAVYRLQTVDHNGVPMEPRAWKLKRFFSTDRPVTGAVNLTKDSNGNLWVLFGTGRLWSQEDLSPCVGTSTKACLENHDQYLFGIKEELNDNGFMTFRDRTLDQNLVVNVSGTIVTKTGALRDYPSQTAPGAAWLSRYEVLARLLKSSKTAGYKRRLDAGLRLGNVKPQNGRRFEMMLTQPKLLPLGSGKSVMTFTTFEPNTSGCGAAGKGFIYMVDTYTGLPSPYVPDAHVRDPDEKVSSSDYIQQDHLVGAVAAGAGNPTEAYILTTGAGVTIAAQGADNTIHTINFPKSEMNSGHVTAWREVLDRGNVSPEVMTRGLVD
jgi:type IV pilus assembly protein PilY1